MPANDIIQAWLLKSAHDLQTAQIVASHLPDFDDTIAFHCQQSIEKALKGYLVYLDIEFKPVHDLGYLLNLVGTKDDSLDPYYDKVDRVSRFAVQIRYPEQVINLTKEQIREAIELAILIFELVQNKITFISH
jgi:HEPN domain-containing protein